MNSTYFVWEKKTTTHTRRCRCSLGSNTDGEVSPRLILFFFFISQAFAGLSASVSAETN